MTTSDEKRVGELVERLRYDAQCLGPCAYADDFNAAADALSPPPSARADKADKADKAQGLPEPALTYLWTQEGMQHEDFEPWPRDDSPWVPRADYDDAVAFAERMREERDRPIPMLLFCPRCQKQHVDAPDVFTPVGACACAGPDQCATCISNKEAYEEWIAGHPWTNPPHATHTCKHCGLNWRPSNANTDGVPALVPLEHKHSERFLDAFPERHADSRAAALQEERDSAVRNLKEETAIVDRIWNMLGSPSYESLKGRSIYDLIADLQAEVERSRAAVTRMHDLLDLLAARFNGYLPWPEELRDAIVRGHEAAIADTLKQADALCTLPSPPAHRCGQCHKCLEGQVVYMSPGWTVPVTSTRMVLCETCGNKRCPHATDCALACTNSNEPGQPGSVYSDPPPAQVAPPEQAEKAGGAK